MGEQFVVTGPSTAPFKKKTIDELLNEKRSRYDVWMDELSESYQTIKDFSNMDPTDVFRSLSQFSGRASEMRSLLGTVEDKKGQQFRTKIIDPFIEECDRQFRFHSRLQAIVEMDAKLAGGRFA